MSDLHFTESQLRVLRACVVHQFISFEGSYRRVVNRDIAYAAQLAQKCKELAEVYSMIAEVGLELMTESDSLRLFMYPEKRFQAEDDKREVLRSLASIGGRTLF